MTFVRRIAQPGMRADGDSLSFDTWLSYFQFGGQEYPFGLNQTLIGNKETIAPGFPGFVQSLYKQNGIVFALIAARALLFSEVRFQWRVLANGRPGKLFGTQDLAPLETPWPGGTTGDLLAAAEADVSLAGNFFAARRPNPGGTDRIKRLRPDWVQMVLGSDSDPDVEGYDIDAEVIGYLYHAGGIGADDDPEPLFPEEVCHYAPLPDPVAPYRGMSWLQPVIQEILGDKAATGHKLKFFENGAVPSMIVKHPETDPEKFKKWIEIFRGTHEGRHNAYRTLFLSAGADATPVGTNLQQIDFRAVQAYGETRLAAAAGVPPTVIGLSESLAGSALNAGNYESAIRMFGSLKIRPLWRNFSGSMQRIVQPPPGAQLWYDDRDVPALKADGQDAATETSLQAASMASLITAGFDPDSVRDGVTSNDLTLLSHTGLTSVQLLPPGTTDPTQAISFTTARDIQDAAALIRLGWRDAAAPLNGHGGKERSGRVLAAITNGGDQ